MSLSSLSLSNLSWLAAVLSGIAVGGGAWLFFDQLYTLYRRWWAMRKGRWQSSLAQWHSYEEQDIVLSEDTFYGIDADTFSRMRSISISISMLLGGWIFMSGIPFIGIIVALLGIIFPRWWMRLLRERRQWDILRQVRDFTIMLNLAVSLGGSLLWSLRDISGQDDLLLNLRLRHQLERHSDPLVVLKRLAADLRSPHIKALAQRLQAAESGASGQQEAVLVAVDAIVVDLQETAAEAIEETPLRLMFPMLVTLLPPVIVILLMPMVGRILAVISGKAF